MPIRNYRIFGIALLLVIPVVCAKMALHYSGWEFISLGTLHASMVTGTFFVLGFLLSATIADYKESEKIPAEVSSVLDNMFDDARSIHPGYPKFDLTLFQKRLASIAKSFGDDVRFGKHQTQRSISQLSESFAAMEAAGVPPNFIVKFKQQQAQLTRALYRVNYIQRIHFIPSATILARSIVVFVVAVLLLTDIEPFYSGMILDGIITFILIYILRLITVISIPFRREGKTQDDVSLFLIDRAKRHLSRPAKE